MTLRDKVLYNGWVLSERSEAIAGFSRGRAYTKYTEWKCAAICACHDLVLNRYFADSDGIREIIPNIWAAKSKVVGVFSKVMECGRACVVI